MKVALPIWAGRVAPVFEVARSFALLDIARGRVLRRHEERFDAPDERSRFEALAGLGVEVLVCGGISRETEGMAAAYGIEVVPFVAGDSDAVAEAFASGALPHPDFAMPGCWPGEEDAAGAAPAHVDPGRRGTR